MIFGSALPRQKFQSSNVTMPPSHPLPFDTTAFSTVEEYVTSLLSFSTDPLLRLLCGGVHILDFFTKDAPGSTPCDLYSAIIPLSWREFFSTQDMDQVLELLLRLPIQSLRAREDVPSDLREFIEKVRQHSLKREFVREEQSERVRKQTRPGTERALYAGMKPKKLHEVSIFSYPPSDESI